jgi:hypothetical protein
VLFLFLGRTRIAPRSLIYRESVWRGACPIYFADVASRYRLAVPSLYTTPARVVRARFILAMCRGRSLPSLYISPLGGVRARFILRDVRRIACSPHYVQLPVEGSVLDLFLGAVRTSDIQFSDVSSVRIPDT